MPPNTSSETAQPTGNRKRAPSERVVPVIPLGLNKPKPSKPNKRKESDLVEHTTVSAELLSSTENPGRTANGVEKLQNEGRNTQTETVVNGAVRMPANGTFGARPSAQMSISLGSTLEAPSTPPPEEQAAEAATPLSSRKPADIGHIRTELPPLAPTFVPSAEQHTPRSAASSHSNRPSSNLYSHTASTNSNGIMFGNQESSTSSPAPPHSGGSGGFMPPPYGNMGPHQPYYTPHGHSHHISEPVSQRLFQPMYSQHAMPWNMRNGYGQPQAPYFQPHNHNAFRYPPRDTFTPSQPQQANGRSSRSRSGSRPSSTTANYRVAKTLQSPTTPMSPVDALESGTAIAPEQKAAFSGHAHPRSHMNHQMPPPPGSQYPPPEFTSIMENAEAVRAHILSQFNDMSFSDCHLIATDPSNGREHLFRAHRIILSRSPTFATLMQNSETPHEVRLSLAGKYDHVDALTDALKYMYGGPLLQIDHQRPGSSAGERFPSNIDRMEHALRYIGTGQALGLRSVALRGVEVAAGLLHWDTISLALGFALEGGLSQVWNVEDGSEYCASTASSEDLFGRAESTSAPIYDPDATHLLHRLVNFTVHMFPPNFYLDSSAPQLGSCARLPGVPPSHENRQSRSDPRLSQIRFGEMSIDDHQRPSFATTTISSVLLSLPFQILKCVLENYDLAARIGAETVASIMRQVVAERETRRNKVLSARNQSGDRTDSQLVPNLYWQESVEPSAQHRAGSRLARRKRDIDTPPSSGACSERNK